MECILIIPVGSKKTFFPGTLNLYVVCTLVMVKDTCCNYIISFGDQSKIFWVPRLKHTGMLNISKSKRSRGWKDSFALLHFLCVTIKTVSFMEGFLCKYCLNYLLEMYIYTLLIYRMVQSFPADNRAKSLLRITFNIHYWTWVWAI